MTPGKKGNLKTKLAIVLLLFFIIGGIGLYVFYRAFYYPGIRFEEKSKIVYIHEDWNFAQVMDMLVNKHVLKRPKAFSLLAKIKGYTEHIKPGRYKIMSDISNMQLVDLLISGKQEPETIVIHNLRTVNELAGMLAYRIEADSTAIIKVMTDKQVIKKYGFDGATFSAMFIPGIYHFLWTDSPENFVEQMHNNYEDFWTPERRKLAAAIPLTPIQVSILASIVQAEQSVIESEKPIIAGLYINRLKQGIPLQCDPTLIYARGDFSIMRVREKDKELDSPYNTYMHTGLPPGPIDMPEPSALDAVLHYQKSDYIYMCAEADFSGKTHFTSSLKEQEEYATKYQRALTKRGIQR